MAGTWVPGADGSGFGIENLPFGVVRPRGGEPRIAVRVGDFALDQRALRLHEALAAPLLNPFLAAGPGVWADVRRRLQAMLAPEAERAAVEAALLPLDGCETLLPFAPGDYVDFYSSLEHATALGRILRPGTEPLAPNWRHLPVGYHGRAGTVAVSGTPVRRPHGQRAPETEGAAPTFGPERRLDVEVELGFVTGPGPHVFGFVLVNDWSAREIQRWEYRPLGPFLGKSFLTSVSPWVVPAAALAARRVPGPPQDPPPLEHLRVPEPRALDVDLELALRPRAATAETVVSRVNASALYWSPEQQLAHVISNGSSVRAGDLFASGTISGSEPGTAGSLVELTWNGRDELELAGGARRTFLEDGDEAIVRGHAGAVSLGEVRGRVEG